jgi:glyoxylase-like metal-dependent hydrolase (beta-lactamase superfamily II)
MAIKQIKVGYDNFSYIVFCKKKNKAAIVDPSYDTTVGVEFLSSNKLELQYIINTHYHNDHSKGNQTLKRLYPLAEIVLSKEDGDNLDMKIDRIVMDNDLLYLGDIRLLFLMTPGHTSGGICVLVNNEALLTGDTLFIGDCGRIDLPGGNLKQMYETLHKKIMSLPDHLIVYPGHDYGDKPFDSLGNQKTNFSTYFKDVMHLIEKR